VLDISRLKKPPKMKKNGCGIWPNCYNFLAMINYHHPRIRLINDSFRRGRISAAPDRKAGELTSGINSRADRVKGD